MADCNSSGHLWGISDKCMFCGIDCPPEDLSQFKIMNLATDWGYEEHYKCLECGALVADRSVHLKWHREAQHG